MTTSTVMIENPHWGDPEHWHPDDGRFHCDAARCGLELEDAYWRDTIMIPLKGVTVYRWTQVWNGESWDLMSKEYVGERDYCWCNALCFREWYEWQYEEDDEDFLVAKGLMADLRQKVYEFAAREGC